jgi:small subunit ribosomal protein S3
MIERKFIDEGILVSKLNQFLKRRLRRVGYIGVEVEETPITTRVNIKVERPGLVIGRKGRSIRQLTEEIEQKFGLENTQIKIDEVEVPELNPAVMARRIASSLERGINYRRVIHWSLEKIMGAGAQGAEITVSGKLVGKGGKSRSERVAAGYIKKAGESSKLVEESQTQAVRKAGIIGITVRIVPPGVVFPDKVDISRLEKGVKEEEGKEPRGMGKTEKEEAEGKPGEEKGKGTKKETPAEKKEEEASAAEGGKKKPKGKKVKENGNTEKQGNKGDESGGTGEQA